MVMGVQRSGTTALFDALCHGGVTAFQESRDDDIYDNYYLRPEAELRALFEEIPGPVLLKPINETFRRSVGAVFVEYRAYDLHIVWIYRDPVNATHSIQMFGFDVASSTLQELAQQWKRRNQSVLDALHRYSSRITIVRYEDLASCPSMAIALSARLGIGALLNFRGDSGDGRRDMAPEQQMLVDDVTRTTRACMDAARGVLPVAPAARPFLEARPASEDFEAAFSRDPLGQVRQASEVASVHSLRQPNSWVVLRYHDVAAGLSDLERSSEGLHRAARLRRLLEPQLTPERICLSALRIQRCTRRILADLATGVQFDLVSAFARRLAAELDAECRAGRDPDSLMARVAAESKFTADESAELRQFLNGLLRPLTDFVATAGHRLLFHPADDANLRERPADIPAFVDEITRLFPPAIAAKRITRRPCFIGGREIPARASVYLAIFAANRDPAQYRQPDELILRRTGPPHLSFSDGPHAALVRRLGQMQRESVLRVLLSEFPPLRPLCLARDISFTALPEFYVPAALPVRFDA